MIPSSDCRGHGDLINAARAGNPRGQLVSYTTPRDMIESKSTP
jgi:hypothetical protein